MIREILSGLLWQGRVALRSGDVRVFAAHGYVDEGYRPSRVPFLSVVGPLGLFSEPERENGRTGVATFRVPGHLIGRPRASGDSVPPNGSLKLRLDGRATVTLTGLPGGSFASSATGPALAAAINARLASALAGGLFQEPTGAPLTDPLLLEALAAVIARWDVEGSRLALSSDEGIPSMEFRSSVEVLPVTGGIEGALGLEPPERSQEGRLFLSKIRAPKAMAIDVQVDLWAGSQVDLASIMDTVALAIPTRGQMVLRPSLLAEDVPEGATSVRLLTRGEPTTVLSLVHLEASDQNLERARGGRVDLTAGASFLPASEGLRLSGTGTASVLVYPTPAVPDPFHADNPAPDGLALSLGLRVAAGAVEAQTLPVAVLMAQGQPVLRLIVRYEQVGTRLMGEVVATATLAQATGTQVAETRWRLPVEQLEAGVALHARLEAGEGVVWLSADGVPQPLQDAEATPAPPVAAPGVTVAASDMVLTLGAQAGTPLDFTVDHVHLVAEPVGPLDPALRRSVTAASRLKPGDVVVLGTSEDGFRVGKQRFQALVLGLEGDRVTLSRPVEGAWARGRTLVFQEECFFFQTQLRRRDDLLNHLYRCCVDYRVSALMDEPNARSTARLVEKPVLDLIARGAARGASGHPGTSVTEVETARRGTI
ncbi:hypothetical protein COCOR_03262 [Corallococcus coralloides DSM 2259]|uniref:Uncharacterized protein n=1 Tax=Corallococcus coralloides (strain ATCC 25202 / DSM 2259 / NBRC 100086 / M2) TaxID=1144275 RepID=H8MGK0_CORCM|nr:hypothetical protein [Corallococcus coralloides]AFE05114.1 hypothetical protein COCOR_03262 [Corallococcus coralloides DSM 2259]